MVGVMIGDAVLANKMANRLLELGIYAVGFSYPVVPKGQARIRTQMNASLTKDDLDVAAAAFSEVAHEIGALG